MKMKYTERNLSRYRRLIKPMACLTLALSAIMSAHNASATTKTFAFDGAVVWCNGDGSAYTQNGPGGGPNPAPTFDGWRENSVLNNPQTSDPNGMIGFGVTAETVAPAGAVNANDRYAIQLNYWNSQANSVAEGAENAPFGYSPGNACMLFYYTNTPQMGQFTITYPATPSTFRQTEVNWHLQHPKAYPTFVPFADFNTMDDGTGTGTTIDVSLKGSNPTKGGPTGYVSTFKGCSWDTNSCTNGSAVPDTGVTPVKSTDTNVFPEKFSDITSIPTQWNISFNPSFGNPGVKTPVNQPQPHVWDASYDIWFDTTAQTGHGVAPYGDARGQNDGLEIMVWMNSNGSYVDTGVAGGFPAEGTSGFVQPTGHIRERVLINGVFYDVWVGRLNNPYFAPVGGKTILPTQEPHECPTLAVNGGPGKTCGIEWNVVSFVATKDKNGTDFRKNSMSMDAKVFADYILGIPNGLYTSYADTVPNTAKRADHVVLQCPASNMNQELSAPTINCLSADWYLTSVQAGFEPWIGGNGLQSDLFKAHVSTKSTGIQTGLTAGDGTPIINWVTPFEVVYSGCSSYTNTNTANFFIDGTNNDTQQPIRYPASGVVDMGTQDQATKQFTKLVTDAMLPMHGTATIHFTSSCGTPENVTVFIDPSGRVLYSDGKTPVQGATVTLQYSTSGTSGGPFAAVPNNNAGLSTPIMQPNDNTKNSMLSTAVGAYAWNTIPGWYKVNANLANCGSVTTTAQQVTATHAIENLNIILPCAPPAPLNAPPATGNNNGVTVQLTVNGVDWSNGYCRNIVLKNTTNKAVTWKVNFNLPFPGNITQTWNVNYTKSGNTMSVWGIGWDNVLQPGQVFSDIGFCATK